jgi:hypothetical protein
MKTPPQLNTALLVALIALILSTSYLLDSTALDAPGAADVAVTEHREQIKVLRAAIDMCGGHEAVALADGAFQCVKTTIAEVSQ